MAKRDVPGTDKNSEQMQVHAEPAPLYASGFGLRATSNDVTLVLTRSVGATLMTPTGPQEVGVNQLAGTVVMSPQTAKDLSILLSKTVEDHENKYGKINTDYTASR